MPRDHRAHNRLTQLAAHLPAALASASAAGTPSAITAVAPATVTDPDAPLTREEIDHFLLEGYVALPGLIPDDLNKALKADVDVLMRDRAEKRADLIVSYGTLGELCAYPPVVDKVQQLMAAYGNGKTQCGMHHIHANKQEPGTGSSDWHQDYHSAADTYLREQLMIHVFFYFDGLDGTIGDLMVLPRSQYAYWDGRSMQALFGDAELPGSRTFGTGNPLPRGTAVICHSALVHGRRRRPGGEGRHRYFVDISYCQPGPRAWPIDMARKAAERALAAERGLAGGRGGERYGCLWDNTCFVAPEQQPETVRAFERRRARYREQVMRMTAQRHPGLGGGNG